MMLPLCYEPDRQSTADYTMKTYWNPRLAASICGFFLLTLLGFPTPNPIRSFLFQQRKPFMECPTYFMLVTSIDVPPVQR